MPAPHLHILLAKSVTEHIGSKAIRNILHRGNAFIVAGSLGPDLPYASIADDDLLLNNRSFLADLLHTERTNEIILSGFRYIKDRRNLEESIPLFSFFTGYLTHFTADCIFHPFIRDKTGDYELNKAAHRILEMKLDVICFYFFNARKNGFADLNSTYYSDQIKSILKCRGSVHVYNLFISLIKDVYNIDINQDEVPGWISGLHRMLDYSTGTNARILKKIKIFNSYLFPNISEIIPEIEQICNLNEPVDRRTNFLKTSRINFFNDCIPRFYKITIPLIIKAYVFIFKEGPAITKSELPALNLDNGRLTEVDNKPDETPFFWKS